MYQVTQYNNKEREGRKGRELLYWIFIKKVKLCSGCRVDSDCVATHQCLSGRCFPKPGKVLLKSIVLGPATCLDCLNSRISVSLVGKRTSQQPGGVTCSSALFNFDLTSNSLKTLDSENTLDTCYKVNILISNILLQCQCSLVHIEVSSEELSLMP